MRHRKLTTKLGLNTGPRNALLRNLARGILTHERVKTTSARAKAARSFVEKLITLGKANTLHARRQAASLLPDKDVIRKLFSEIAPLFQKRNGGYTRIIRLDSRTGDCAEMVVFELVEKTVLATEEKKKDQKKETMKNKSTKRTGKEEAQKDTVIQSQ